LTASSIKQRKNNGSPSSPHNFAGTTPSARGKARPSAKNENFVATFVADIDKRFPSLELAFFVDLVVFGDRSVASRG
jgi:hypothetical protein